MVKTLPFACDLWVRREGPRCENHNPMCSCPRRPFRDGFPLSESRRNGLLASGEGEHVAYDTRRVKKLIPSCRRAVIVHAVFSTCFTRATRPELSTASLIRFITPSGWLQEPARITESDAIRRGMMGQRRPRSQPIPRTGVWERKRDGIATAEGLKGVSAGGLAQSQWTPLIFSELTSGAPIARTLTIIGMRCENVCVGAAC